MASIRLKNLIANVAALRKELLPRRFDPIGNYPDRVHARAAGYRLLVHAEIEQYLEERCLEIALAALGEWSKLRHPSVAVLGLLAFCERSVDGPPSSLTAPQANAATAWQKKVDINQKVNQAMTIYSYNVKNNHGVKESNILNLLLPLGFDITKIDQTWLADMESFGAGRGLVAHTSTIRKSIDPASEYSTVKRIIGPIRSLDSELNTLVL